MWIGHATLKLTAVPLKSKEKEKNEDGGKEREEAQEESTAVPSPESANKSTIGNTAKLLL